MSTVLIALVVIAWIAGLVDVLANRDHLDRTKRLAWILLIVILPIIGTGIYLILRPDQHRQAGQDASTGTGGAPN